MSFYVCSYVAPRLSAAYLSWVGMRLLVWGMGLEALLHGVCIVGAVCLTMSAAISLCLLGYYDFSPGPIVFCPLCYALYHSGLHSRPQCCRLSPPPTVHNRLLACLSAGHSACYVSCSGYLDFVKFLSSQGCIGAQSLAVATN